MAPLCFPFDSWDDSERWSFLSQPSLHNTELQLQEPTVDSDVLSHSSPHSIMLTAQFSCFAGQGDAADGEARGRDGPQACNSGIKLQCTN